MPPIFSNIRPRRAVLPSFGILLLGLTACVSTAPPPMIDHDGDRIRRAEIQAMREWRTCRDDALALDASAAGEAAAARHGASARMLEGCEATLPASVKARNREKRMRAAALAVQNHLKAGDVTAARESFSRFREGFPRAELRLADGSSFAESMALLLGLADRDDPGALALADIGDPLKAELRRLRYWRTR